MKRESRMIDPNRMAKSFEEEQKVLPEAKDEKHPSRKSSKISSTKDMIDIIEEIEEEENFLDSDDSFTKEFYQTMHQDVLMRGMNDQEKH